MNDVSFPGQTRGKCNAFITIQELLAFLVTVCVLLALLLPAIQVAREKARRAECADNLRHLALAMQNYYDANKSYPLLGCYTKTTANGSIRYDYPRINSIVALMPFMDYAETGAMLLDMDTESPRMNGIGTIKNTVADVSVKLPVMAQDRELPTLICPSDKGKRYAGERTEIPLAARSYLYCSGDFPDAGAYKYCLHGNNGSTSDKVTSIAVDNYHQFNHNTRTGISAMIDYHDQDYIADGLGKTILFGEVVRGIEGSRELKTSARLTSQEQGNPTSLPEHDGSPVGNSVAAADCLSEQYRKANPQMWDTDIAALDYIGGVRAYCAIPQFATFSTITPPNSPQCVAFHNDRVLLSTGSYHWGGANVALYDGSVVFMHDKINAVTPNVALPMIKDFGPSDYGVWGAYGSVNGESKTVAL